MKNSILLITLMFAFQLGYSQNSGRLHLNFNHLFNGKKVAFDSTYFNAHGEDVKFTTINYFISNISLIGPDGSIYTVPQDSSYFILRHTPDTDQRTIVLKDIPAGEYSSVRFTIGVDSLRNTMSIDKRTGNLDVGEGARGMYWVWNSGYIFFKLEGISSVSPEKMKNRFTYHIGGFGGYRTRTINSIRERELKFSPFIIDKMNIRSLEVNVNLDKFFSGPFNLKISEKPNVMWGQESEKIADNYKEAFEAK